MCSSAIFRRVSAADCSCLKLVTMLDCMAFIFMDNDVIIIDVNDETLCG